MEEVKQEESELRLNKQDYLENNKRRKSENTELHLQVQELLQYKNFVE
jgi:hypothetical protein